jgi:hypothetical protein
MHSARDGERLLFASNFVFKPLSAFLMEENFTPAAFAYAVH